MSFRSKTELVVKQSSTSKNVDTEAEGFTLLEALTRQPVKIKQNDRVGHKTETCSGY
jgi:hypothetical protein